jgi:hypothetical protein
MVSAPFLRRFAGKLGNNEMSGAHAGESIPEYQSTSAAVVMKLPMRIKRQAG